MTRRSPWIIEKCPPAERPYRQWRWRVLSWARRRGVVEFVTQRAVRFRAEGAAEAEWIPLRRIRDRSGALVKGAELEIETVKVARHFRSQREGQAWINEQKRYETPAGKAA